MSRVPFYSFTLVPFLASWGMVTEEGVRNVLLLRGCHLQTEGSFVRGAPCVRMKEFNHLASVEDNGAH